MSSYFEPLAFPACTECDSDPASGPSPLLRFELEAVVLPSEHVTAGLISGHSQGVGEKLLPSLPCHRHLLTGCTLCKPCKVPKVPTLPSTHNAVDGMHSSIVSPPYSRREQRTTSSDQRATSSDQQATSETNALGRWGKIEEKEAVPRRNEAELSVGRRLTSLSVPRAAFSTKPTSHDVAQCTSSPP